MKKLKKGTAMVLSLLLMFGVFGMVPLSASAASDQTNEFFFTDEFQYEIREDNTIEIVKYIVSSSEEVTVPAEIDGRAVTVIGESAFEKCEQLTTVNLPDGITTLGDEAFYRCVNLTEIVIPNSVTSIGAGAFKDCQALQTLTLPDGLTEINDSTFWGCESLTYIKVPSSVNAISARAFGRCSNLARIDIWGRTTTLHAIAFTATKNIAIYGRPNSPAKSYAEDKKLPFVEIGMMGDLNFDGNIDMTDVLLLQQAYSHLFTLTDDMFEVADINHDSKADLYDIMLIRMYIIGEIPSLEDL